MERKTIINSTVNLVKVIFDLTQMFETIIKKMEIEIDELKCKNYELHEKWIHFEQQKLLFNYKGDVEKLDHELEPSPKESIQNFCKVCGKPIAAKRVVCSNACRSEYARRSRKQNTVEKSYIAASAMADDIINGLNEQIAISKAAKGKIKENATAPEIKPTENQSPGK